MKRVGRALLALLIVCVLALPVAGCDAADVSTDTSSQESITAPETTTQPTDIPEEPTAAEPEPEQAPAPEPTPQPEATPPAETYSAPTQVAPQSTTVYVTNTGHKYHREGCRYLKQSSNPISKDDAVAQGYEPCKVCQP